jgi:lysophospholipase L1-like esterase
MTGTLHDLQGIAAMRQILVYGDSVAWGIIPGSLRRLSFGKRWPGALDFLLNQQGAGVRVIENCLNSSKTVLDDPFRSGRNGAQGLAEVVELYSPLALIIIALGTNDFQATHDNRAWASVLGVGRLIGIVRQAPVEPGMPRPDILALASPRFDEPKAENFLKFLGAPERSKGFAGALEDMAHAKSARFFDLNSVTSASPADGIHLDEAQHAWSPLRLPRSFWQAMDYV